MPPYLEVILLFIVTVGLGLLGIHVWNRRSSSPSTEEPAIEEVQEEEEENHDTYSCLNCGADLADEDDERFCYQCGYFLTDECPACKQDLTSWEERYDSALEFCPLCGHQLIRPRA